MQRIAMPLSTEDNKALKEFRVLIIDYLKNDECCPKSIKNYLEEIVRQDEILLSFLRGRKYRVKYAWETLKRNTEVRFLECADLFPKTIPDRVLSHVRNQEIVGVLKSRDNYNRHVVIFNASAWDPDICSADEMLIVYIKLMEKLLKNDIFAREGFTFIQECSCTGVKVARQYSLRVIKNLIKVFLHAFPIQLKSVYYVNVPTFSLYLFSLGRPFFPKKLRERLTVRSLTEGFKALDEVMSPNRLPQFLGGSLSFREAVDENYDFV